MAARQKVNAIKEVVNGSWAEIMLSRRLSMAARQRVIAIKEIVSGS